jgi:hypothetical protein
LWRNETKQNFAKYIDSQNIWNFAKLMMNILLSFVFRKTKKTCETRNPNYHYSSFCFALIETWWYISLYAINKKNCINSINFLDSTKITSYITSKQHPTAFCKEVTIERTWEGSVVGSGGVIIQSIVMINGTVSWYRVVMPTLRYFTIETLRFYAFVNKKNLTNVYFSL